MKNNYQEIRELEPQAVFNHFADILAIPHPSCHEEKIATYLLSFAKEHGFSARCDEAGNVIMTVPASQGHEHSPRVILQAHMDMVPVAATGVTHDFEKDPIDAYVDDGWIKARGTTLGADDGLGESMILALIGDPANLHGPLTAVFTVEEEVTMKGSLNLSHDDLHGEYLINLDSEEDGTLCVSCAGSCDVNFTYPVDRIVTQDTSCFDIALRHCTGGHSGSDIHKGHANAAIVLCRILAALEEQFEIFIDFIRAGQVRNAVPQEAFVRVRIPNESSEDFKKAFEELSDKTSRLYANTDPDAVFAIEQMHDVKGDTEVLSLVDSEILLRFISTIPNGVFRLWSEDMSIPETSSNLGLIRTKDDTIEIGCMPRSLKESGLDEIITTLSCAGEMTGCEVNCDHRHPCWSSPSDNALISTLQKAYKEICSKQFKVMAIHAGLECAQFAQKAPHLQLVSLGSTLLAPHSPDERALICGVGELYDTLRLALSNI